MKGWLYTLKILLILAALVTQGWAFGVANTLVWVLAGILLLALVNWYQTKRAWRHLYRMVGLTENINTSKDLQQAIRQGKELSNDISHLTTSIEVIGQESFPELMKSIRNGELRGSLLDAHHRIVDLRKNEQYQNWITKGIASISGLRSSDISLEEYSCQVISTVVKYLGANQGAFFILKQDEGNDYLESLACYAYNKKESITRRINPGEGLVGQAYYEKEMIFLADVPHDYIKITSGLGEALPRCICVVRLCFEESFYGALEVASFHKLLPHELDYLKEIGGIVGYNLHALESKIKTELLLAESQQMAQEVKAQEGELRQNMEELTATQKLMKRKQIELDAVMDSLAVVELSMDAVIKNVNSMFLGSSGYEAGDLLHKPYTDFIPRLDSDRQQFELMWDSLKSGQSFSGEFRLVNKRGELLWMLGNFTPLFNDNGKPYKIMVITLFTTQEKAKMLELQELVGGFKNNFPMAEINADMSFKTANDLFLNEFGIKRMNLRKLTAAELFHNGSLTQVKSNLDDPLSTNTGIHMNLAMRSTDGLLKQVNATMIKLHQTTGAKKGLLIITNVTV